VDWAQYGDPTGKDIDTVVDWVERIPFTENPQLRDAGDGKLPDLQGATVGKQLDIEKIGVSAGVRQ